MGSAETPTIVVGARPSVRRQSRVALVAAWRQDGETANYVASDSG